jgi:hypothetical protein
MLRCTLNDQLTRPDLFVAILSVVLLLVRSLIGRFNEPAAIFMVSLESGQT